MISVQGRGYGDAWRCLAPQKGPISTPRQIPASTLKQTVSLGKNAFCCQKSTKYKCGEINATKATLNQR